MAQISGTAVGLAAVGGLLIYAGVSDKQPVAALRELVTGKSFPPAPFTKPASSSATSGDFANIGTFPSGVTGGTQFGQAIASEAVAQVGKPYRWGAAGPNAFDCSGLLYWAIRHAGDPSYPRLITAAIAVSTRFVKISRSQVGAGDVLYRPGHVAIATSNSGLVEAPRTGIPVRTREIRGNEFTMYLRYVGLKSRSPVP
jgi:peptidoglycan DL-endopeptidase CwlO